MDKTFYMFGVLYVQWTYKGRLISAVKDQVDFLGKETFEQDVIDLENDLDTSPDEIDFCPMWQPTTEELFKSIQAEYNYMRDEEIM